jgi:hypothetical protein
MTPAPAFAPLFQALHLLGLLLWIGPTLGGYFILRAARGTGDPKLVAWVRRPYQTLLAVEHFGLLLVLASGLGRAWTLGWLADPPAWLWLKLLLVGLVVVPVELADIWIGHFLAGPALAGVRPSPAPARHLRLQDRFAAYSAAPLAATLLLIVFLVVWKPVW